MLKLHVLELRLRMVESKLTNNRALEILKSFPEASIEEYPLSSRTGAYWPRLARWLNTQRDPFLKSLDDNS